MTKTTTKQSATKTLKVQTNLKAGAISINHVEVGLSATPAVTRSEQLKNKGAKKTLKIQTNLKAGAISINHVEVGLKAN